MTVSRLAALTFAILVAISTAAWSQSDPLQDANQLFRQGQFDRAMDRVNSYLASRPKDARGRFLKGLILTEQNKPNEAIKVFTELSQDYPELPEPYNNLAVLYASQGQYEKARNSLEMAIRTHPSYATAHENLGDIYAKMASQAYDKALQLDRSNTAAQTKLNLIKDLFSQSGTATASRQPATPPTKVAAATPTPAAPANTVATPAPAAPALPATPVKAPEKAEAKAVVPTPPAKAAEKAPEKSETAKPAAPARSNEEVLRSVNSWARAWASNDVPGYLSHYASDFQTPNGMSRNAWEAERKTRIQKPRKIEVDVQSPSVKFDDRGRAIVTFRQHYHSGPLNVTSTKTLVMVKNGDKWLIQQERSGS